MKDRKELNNIHQNISKYCANLSHKCEKFDIKRIKSISSILKHSDRKVETEYTDIRTYIKDVDIWINNKRKNLNDTEYKDEPETKEKEMTAGELLDTLKFAFVQLQNNANIKYFKSDIATYLRHTNNKKDDDELYDGKSNIDDIIEMKKTRGYELYDFVRTVYNDLPSIIRNDREDKSDITESYYNDLRNSISSIIYEKYTNNKISTEKMNRLIMMANEAVSEEEALDNKNDKSMDISKEVEKSEKDLKKDTGTIIDTMDKSMNISDK